MAYIAPDSLILLLRGVPLEPDYEHTVRLSQGAQSGVISSYHKYSIDKHTYQRVNSNTIRVGIGADNLYDCNYLMFQNSAYSNRWFYAFITEVNYINNECTEIKYEIDVMQTYMYDWELGTCFVEREHSVTDEIGDNVIEEGLPYGIHEYSGYDYINELKKIDILLMEIDTNTPTQPMSVITPAGTTAGKLYSFDISDAGRIAALNAALAAQVSTPENVLSLYEAPEGIINYDTFGFITGAKTIIKTFGGIIGSESFDGYTPKNKKLYTYPYNYFHVDNGKGGSLQLRYEYFENLTPQLKIEGCITPPVEVIVTPTGYKGVYRANYNPSLYSESLAISGYPVCSWANDTWKQQLIGASVNALANAPMQALEIAGGIGMMQVGTASGDLGMGRWGGRNTLSGLGGVKDSMQSMITAMSKRDITPHTTYGSQNSGGALGFNADINFRTARCHITGDYAKTIDDYFTRFGYQTNKLKVPNINSRPHWNYVKTVGCELKSGESLPAQDAALIKQIFDKGITFWKQITEVGRFDLDNSV